MRFLLDENVEYRLALYLRSLEHDVTAIAKDYPEALPDNEVLAIAHRERRILITDDSDFGELIFRQHQPHAGVIYFRLPAATFVDKAAWMDRLLASHQHELTEFLTVSRRRLRIRERPPN